MKSKSGLAILISAVVLLYVTFNLCNWREKNMIQWDCTGYYLYLPATIIYQDLGNLRFYEEVVYSHYLNNANTTYGLYPQQATGRVVNKYALGTSLFELPFFLLAHFYCNVFPDFPADGYSQPYYVMIVFAILFWVLSGLFVLRKLLLRYFSDATTAITLLLLMFATNLYFYTVFSIGMSHPFSFSAFCFLLYFTDLAYRTGRSKYIVWIGVIMGLIFITRPTNIVVGIVPLLWPVNRSAGINNKLEFLREKTGAVLLACLACTAIMFILFGYLKYTSGNWFHFSYEGESFHYLKPEIFRGLFSYRKGWFVYTPIAFVAMLGFIPLLRQNLKLGLPALLYIVLNIYVVFSWYYWTYGGSFGCRALIESMAVMALPLAAFIQLVLNQRRKALKIVTLTMFSFFIALNAFQSYQLINNVILWDETNREVYWRTFGKLKTTEEDRKLEHKQ